MTKLETVCHGTDKKTYEKEIQPNNNQLKSCFDSKNRVPNDLGDGIYVYGSNGLFKASDCAEKYAKKYRDKGNDHITLIFYLLDTDDKHTLDLDIEEHKNALIKFRQETERRIKEMAKNYDENKGRGQLDGIIINLLNKKLNNEIKVIKKQTFTKFDEEYKTSNFPNSLEYCVKDNTLLSFKNYKHRKIRG